MKKWLARLGWMVLGAVLLAAVVITRGLLLGEHGQVFPDASTSQIESTITNLKKANCSYKVSVFVPRNCKEALTEAVKQSSDKNSAK